MTANISNLISSDAAVAVPQEQQPVYARHLSKVTVVSFPVHRDRVYKSLPERKGVVVSMVDLRGQDLHAFLPAEQVAGVDKAEKQGRLHSLKVGDTLTVEVTVVNKLDQPRGERLFDVFVSEQLVVDDMIVANLDVGTPVNATVLAHLAGKSRQGNVRLNNASDSAGENAAPPTAVLLLGFQVNGQGTKGILPVDQLDLSSYNGNREQRLASALAALAVGATVTVEVLQQPTLNRALGRPNIMLSQIAGKIRTQALAFPVDARLKGRIAKRVQDGFVVECSKDGERVTGLLPLTELGGSSANSFSPGGSAEVVVAGHGAYNGELQLQLTRRGIATGRSAKKVRFHATPPSKAGGKGKK
jgi:hypothetical protein